MVGWHLLLLLAVEIIVYGAIGRHAHSACGWSTGCAVALAIGIYLVLRIVLVGAEFILARWRGGAIPKGLLVSPVRLAAMYLRELGGWILMFSLVMPLVLARRSVIDRQASPKPDKPPIVLVHGLACNRGYWFWF